MVPSSVRASRTTAATALLVLLLLLAWSQPAAGQGLGSAAIFGDVTTAEGQPIPQANIELLYVPTGAVIRTASNPEGRYLLPNVRPGGPYEVRVTALGYSETEHTDLQLRAQQRLELDLTLTQEPIVLEGIEVTLDRRFDTSREGPSIQIQREVINTYPTIERSFLELAALSPVAVQTSEDGGLSISGQNERQNSILIDGALNQDVFGSSSTGTPGAAARAKPMPLDAIQEFRVEVAPFDVRSSGFTGGVLNAITRTGTNNWEASAFSEFRNEALFGSLLLDGADMAPEEYRKHVWGFNVGGPLRQDEAHVFLAAEFEDRREPPPGFTLGVHEPLATRLAADSLARATEILGGYGAEPGTPGQLYLKNPLSNVFARLDWRIGDTHSLTLRHNFSGAARDSTPNRTPFGPYELSSAGYRAESRNHAFNGKLVSRFGDGHSNEISLNVQHTRERSTPNSRSPQVDVKVSSDFGDLALVRRIRSGSRYFSQHSELDQTLVEVSDAVTLARDEIVSTLGVGVDVFHFDRDYRPGSHGYYRFDRLSDLEANEPSYYEINVLDEENDPSNRFTVLQPAIYAQNEHRFPPELVLRYGIRLDVPVFPNDPGYNELVDEEFGLRTDHLPSGKLLVSPRLGFNWQSQTRWRTQLRGGFGIFTGRVPFVWMSDAYRYTGLQPGVLSCEGEDAVPAYDPSAPAPRVCADGTGPADAGQSTVVAFDPDFKYPRELKATWAIDQEIPWDLYFSLEGFFVQTHGRTVVHDLNIPAPGAPDDEGYREAFGLRGNYGDPVALGYEPDRTVDELAQVLSIQNDERTANAWAFTAQLQKRVGTWLDLTASATVASSDDRQSLVFADMLTNYAAAPAGQQVTQRSPRPANFDRPWKYLINARGRLPALLGSAEWSVAYTGVAGQPYSYVYGTDINGDGYSGPGIPLDASNDLLYIPPEPSQIPGGVATKSLLAQFASTVEPCLAEVRDQIMDRNSCRAPATHRVDLRVAQPIEVGGVRLEVTGDVLNVLNLLDSEWGRVWEVDPLVPLLDVVARAETLMSGEPDPLSQAFLGYQGGVVRDPDTGSLRPTTPYTLITPASQWQAQLGLRVSF